MTKKREVFAVETPGVERLMELQAKDFIDKGFRQVHYKDSPLDFYYHKDMDGSITHFKKGNVFSLWVDNRYVIDYVKSLEELTIKE